MSKQTQITKYQQLRQKSQEEISQEQLSHEVEDNKLQLEADLRATQRQLTLEQRELESLKSAPRLDSEKILKRQDKIRGLQEGVKSLVALIEELF